MFFLFGCADIDLPDVLLDSGIIADISILWACDKCVCVSVTI